MEIESFLHDNLDFDTLSEAEVFYKTYKGKELNFFWTAFEIFETNSINMSKLFNIIFQKCKDFFALEKRSSNSPKCFGLLFTEKNAKVNWVNRRREDLKIKLPKSV